MRFVLKVLALPFPEKLLLARALAVVVMVRISHSLLPFQTVRRLVESPGRRVWEGVNPAEPRALRKIVSSVARVSRYVPSATCLTQAMATQLLVRRTGQDVDLRIGVLKADSGELKAHAWIEKDGRVIIGWVPELGDYAMLPLQNG
jgi:hypothetical protein